MRERKAVIEATAGRYQGSGKREKGKILAEFTLLTGYERSYARYVLRTWGKRVYAKRRIYVAGSVKKKRQVERRREYDDKVADVLRRVWVIMDYICGKRLKPILGEMVERLEMFGEIKCDDQIRKKLHRISASTIDRLLAGERRKHEMKGRSRTRPGTLLKHQIPLRTFAEWDDGAPGFVEIDLVAHDGGIAAAEHLYTLCVTDVSSGWTEDEAVLNKAQVWVFNGLKEVRKRLPFPLLGIDSDNGSEFINRRLYEYCIDERLTFTRSRPYRKNDNCFVEQKNWTTVRRHIGYQRLEGEHQQMLLNEIYRHLRLYVNFFQPSMRLKSKERHGSRVKKTYREARTPYQNLIGSGCLTREQREMLARQYDELNPAELIRRIGALRNKLLKMAAVENRKNRKPPTDTPWRQKFLQ